LDPVLFVIAFVLGLAVRQVGLPPLVGFLGAGFVLNAMGFEKGEVLDHLADLGVLLLLFSIGLKLNPRGLLRPEIWAGTSIHMLTSIVFFGAGILGLSAVGLTRFAGLGLGPSLLVAFALSFSSTVFAVKVLEERGEMGSLHGRTAIGILIMQDIVAIVFLTVSMGKMPSPWAILLVAGLIPARPILRWIMGRCGHGELLILFGLLLTAGAAALFEVVSLKPDLGALVAGLLLAGAPKSEELAKGLLGFKDLFLVGFFLAIGLEGVPALADLGIAVLLVVLVPVKVALFFLLLTRFRLRARTSMLASLSLANYSEFGLIVGAVGAANGWISYEWMVIVAISIAISFVAAAPLNTVGHALVTRWEPRLRRFQTAKRRPDDLPIDAGDAEIVIFGMGRIGSGAYDAMRERYGDVVLGVDFDPDTVAEQASAGRRIVLGDATDADFAERARSRDKVRLVMLAMPSLHENYRAIECLRERGYPGRVAALAFFDDEVEQLKEAGVHAVFNTHSEAGAGFAEHAYRIMEGPR
jgi:predicted Kef-type K+ transport protein